MKNRLVKTIMAAAWAGAVFSCVFQEGNDNRHFMDRAGQLVEQYPDSALMMLDSVNTKLLSERQRNICVLLQVQAKNRAHRDITSETDIFQTKDYFIEHRDLNNAALACFYAGKVYESRNTCDEAMACYKNALDWMAGNEYHLKGLVQNNIGTLLYKQGHYADAAAWFTKATRSFAVNDADAKNKAHALISAGNVCTMMQQQDSAFFHYQQALDIASAANDTTLIIWTVQNMGVVYLENEQVRPAREKFLQAVKLARLDGQRAPLLLNLIQTYLLEKNMDSVNYYTKQLMVQIDHIQDTMALANVYRVISMVDEMNGNRLSALNHAKKQIECIETLYENQIVQSVLDVEKRYDFERIQAEKNGLMRKEQRKTNLMVLIALISVTVVSSLISFYLLEKAKTLKRLEEAERKREQLKKWADEEITTAKEEQMRAAKENARINSEKTKTFKHLLNQYFNTMGKVQKLAAEINQDMPPRDIAKTVNAIVYGQTGKLDYNSLKKLVPESMFKIDQLNSTLKESQKMIDSEKSICCLFYFGCDHWDIATFLNIELTTLYTRTTCIRKKLNIGKGGDIKEYIDQWQLRHKNNF